METVSHEIILKIYESIFLISIVKVFKAKLYHQKKKS